VVGVRWWDVGVKLLSWQIQLTCFALFPTFPQLREEDSLGFLASEMVQILSL
jgi:hypothetical protein